jgi:hypothetical protein
VVVRSVVSVEELSVKSPAVRAPKKHGQIVAAPPLDQVGALLEQNRRVLESLQSERQAARREILEASIKYHHEAGEGGLPSPPAPLPEGEGRNTPWVVAGHQPELFHPGVWYKNFILHRLAHQHQAIALNLIVDTDTVKPALLHVPSNCRLLRVPYDRSTMETPYEERIVEDEATFAEMPERLAPIIERWGFEPMLPKFWQEVMRQAKRTPLLGERFAAARRAMERRWGVVQRELPMSRVCQTASFARFARSILVDLSRFHATHNRLVHAYREAHGIRSKHHPVPDLAADGDWLEAPFWAWCKGQARRAHLFVRQVGDTFELRANAELWPRLPVQPERMVDAWRELESRGYKIRSRALTTTMFARLYLGDLFLHGIGGGIYDELTDRLITDFIGIPAPAFLVVSATMLLPLPRHPEAPQHVKLLERQLRDLEFKPELFLPSQVETSALLEAKLQWIQRQPTPHAERVERFRKLRELNGSMHPFVQPQAEKVRIELAKRRDEIECNEVNSRRDYAFCLYPEAMLRGFFSA